MKLDEVATPKEIKCGLIMPAGGNESLDASDWHGSTEVHTNQTAFIKAIKGYFTEHAKAMTDEDDVEVLAQIKAAKTMDDLSEIESWNEFTDSIWIDDRF